MVELTPVPAETGGLRVRRAWPGAGRDLVVEVIGAQGRLLAGRWAHEARQPTLEPYGCDPALPALPRWATAGEVVVHRHRRRAVVRCADRFVKLVRKRGDTLAAVMAATGARAAEAGYRTPAVLGSDAHTVELSVVDGQPLGRCGPERWPAALVDWADRWPGLVNQPASELPTHDAAAETAVVESWVDKASRFHPACAPLLRPAARQVAAMLAEPAMAAGVAHRDLHDGQILVGDGIGLLDFDTAARAEPALDLANLAVHLDLRVAQGVIDADVRQRCRAVIDDLAAGIGVPEQRMRAYAAAARVRLACVYSFRPGWQQVAAAWMRGLSCLPHQHPTSTRWSG